MRINKITIENFKNVVFGELSLVNEENSDGPDILALYGQNGSGKTALVDCLLAFRLLSLGKPLPQEFARYVNKDAEFARVIIDYTADGRAIYEFEFKSSDSSPVIISETLQRLDWDTGRIKTVFTTKGYDICGPRDFAAYLSQYDIPSRQDLYQSGYSFLFCKELWDCTSGWESEKGITLDDATVMHESCVSIIGTKEAESIESGYLFIPTLNSQHAYDEGGLRISTDPSNPSEISIYELEHNLLDIITNINHLVEVLIPGMKLVVNLVPNDSVESKLIYLQTQRDDLVIPLANESRGIQKLVSVAWLLSSVYNDPNAIAVIDEIDAGIFEYLLGEILQVISEEGEGQLIFTSHNLRPLEVIDRQYIAFTTPDPENRFIRMTDIETPLSPRDYYYRSIYLGEKRDLIYEAPSSGDLSLAFMMTSAEKREIEEQLLELDSNQASLWETIDGED